MAVKGGEGATQTELLRLRRLPHRITRRCTATECLPTAHTPRVNPPKPKGLECSRSRCYGRPQIDSPSIASLAARPACSSPRNIATKSEALAHAVAITPTLREAAAVDDDRLQARDHLFSTTTTSTSRHRSGRGSGCASRMRHAHAPNAMGGILGISAHHANTAARHSPARGRGGAAPKELEHGGRENFSAV